MQNPASPADIEARWRPLTSSEALVAQTRLDDGWRSLQRKITGLTLRMPLDADLTADVVRVLADAVTRVLRNPEGLVRGTVSIDDASRTFEYGGTNGAAGGGLYFTDDEIEALLPNTAGSSDGKAFSVMPS